MSDRATVIFLLVFIAFLLVLGGSVISAREDKAAELTQQLAQCRDAGSVTVVAQAAAEWDNALKIAEKCVSDLNACRGFFHAELSRNGSLKCQVDAMAQSAEDEVVKRIERMCRP